MHVVLLYLVLRCCAVSLGLRRSYCCSGSREVTLNAGVEIDSYINKIKHKKVQTTWIIHGNYCGCCLFVNGRIIVVYIYMRAMSPILPRDITGNMLMVNPELWYSICLGGTWKYPVGNYIIPLIGLGVLRYIHHFLNCWHLPWYMYVHWTTFTYSYALATPVVMYWIIRRIFTNPENMINNLHGFFFQQKSMM